MMQEYRHENELSRFEEMMMDLIDDQMELGNFVISDIGEGICYLTTAVTYVCDGRVVTERVRGHMFDVVMT